MGFVVWLTSERAWNAVSVDLARDVIDVLERRVMVMRDAASDDVCLI